MTNWEGLPGTTVEHRTVGPHRAWCFDCGEWCYSSGRSYCMCCDILTLPEEWQGLPLLEVIEKARADERAKRCPAQACPVREERERIEVMLVSEGYEAAAFLVASMTPDGRADHRGGGSDG